MPKLDLAAIPEDNSCSYPAPFNEIARGRFRKKLGDAGGLTQFGVSLCRLESGSASSQRHWHEREEEMVYILDGEVVLVEDEGETILRPGDAAVFKPGVANGHHLVNRSGRDALFLEIGTRPQTEVVHYCDIDLLNIDEGDGDRFTRRDGTPY
ncbi:cupin domain-containing protein [Afifella sp. IM 167]|uniref:cupin domain-containing protein n=1 Tax=Afifella sp. IM 167 TaxID=2033586 RepID=UPI001CCA0099|nr:cupin domain-containing protein [Afifella sp. IM 167]MBZ8133878.1 transcriptional regulator [Afifella sp. IM 167]